MKKYDVVAVTGEYQKDGETKKRYVNCGAVFETEKGMSMKLDVMPTMGEGWFYLFEPRKAGESRTQQASDGFSDKIPF